MGDNLKAVRGRACTTDSDIVFQTETVLDKNECWYMLILLVLRIFKLYLLLQILLISVAGIGIHLTGIVATMYKLVDFFVIDVTLVCCSQLYVWFYIQF